MIFNMIGSGGSSDKSTIIVRTETNSTVGIYTDDSYSTLIKEATYKGLSSYVTISNQESSCPNYSNYWYFERYKTLSANTMEACDAATPVDARYYADSTISTSMNIADSYTARATTYVYSPIDQTLSISCTTDDDGTVYLNDTVLATLTSTKAKTVSFPLVAGINKITIIYTEGTGADGWVTNPLFSVNNNITAMWGTYEPMTITIDKTQLASKLGFTSRYCNFIYNGIDWTLDGNTINLSEYGITYAATNTIGMYINFVYKYNIYGEYWLQNLNNGIYYLKATKGSDTATKVYAITEYGVYRISMSYWAAYINVTFSTDALSLICSDGVTTISATGDLSGGTYTFTVNNIGTWTVTASNGKNSISDSVIVSAQATYSLTLPSLIPTAYQEVEYIQSSGSQYIDTTVSGGSSSAYEIKFNPLGTTATAYEQYFAGARNAFPKLHCNSSTQTIFCSTSGNDAFLAHLANVDMVVSYDGAEVYLDGNQVVATTSTGWGNMTWYVFNAHGESQYKSSMRLYYLKMYKDGSLVRDFSPCYRVSDNIAGLWDRVGKTFYTNIGTGSFVVGADV